MSVIIYKKLGEIIPLVNVKYIEWDDNNEIVILYYNDVRLKYVRLKFEPNDIREIKIIKD